ncbi:MAG: subtilase [Halobacteriovoraceae bacterium]|nr:subtilase [Halobacteriovoraceae bacterium]|tara:strand:+ start:1043 stop:2674 length:1632 start_codon:yes stop_codon:yes gene_type:complete
MKNILWAGILATSTVWAGAEYVPGEIIVKLKDQSSLKSVGLRGQKLNVDIGNFAILKVDQKSSVEATIEKLNNLPDIEYAEPNYIYHAIGTKELAQTTDPDFSKLWGLVNTGNNEPSGSRGNSSPRGIAGADINASQAWTLTKGDRNIKIAVIDTGVDYNHRDLSANIWTNQAEANGTPGVDDDGNGYIDDIHGYDFANDDGDPMDGNGHGTHCAGTIAAEHDNNYQIAGVMAEASIVGIKFLTDSGSGSTANAIRAIDYATKIGVDIMSNSWGGGGYSQALKDAIVRAEQAGIVFTAAAGNSASDNNSIPHYPSNYDVSNVISVAAHNYNDELASFSCYGSRTVHVAAPGRNILSTTPGNSTDVYSGTSMATPHVTGVIGLYLAYHGKSNPKDIRDALMSSSVYAPAYGRKTISGGRVDAYNFLTGVVTERPERPDPNAWRATSVAVFETAHPYPNGMRISQTYNVPGAKFVRVVVDEYDIEVNYDFIRIIDAQGSVIQSIDGKGQNLKTDYVDGDTVTVEFRSDNSINLWGFKITEVEYIQ